MRLNGIVGLLALVLVAFTSVGIADIALADTAPATAVGAPATAATAQTTTVPTPAAPHSNEKFWLVVVGIALTITLLTAVVVRRNPKQTQ